MATIADTLNDIQNLQNQMSCKLKHCAGLVDRMFIRDLMNFTTTYFFALLAHVTLDAMKDYLRPHRHPYVDKYYSMYNKSGVLEELVRLDNISGMFLLWNIFEQHINRERASLPGESERTLENRYKEVLRHFGVVQSIYDALVNEFNLIRLTRNSLHGGGIYRNKTELNFKLKGKKYTLKNGCAVTPIRLMDVAETMWKHFVIVADRRKRSAVFAAGGR